MFIIFIVSRPLTLMFIQIFSYVKYASISFLITVRRLTSLFFFSMCCDLVSLSLGLKYLSKFMFDQQKLTLKLAILSYLYLVKANLYQRVTQGFPLCLLHIILSSESEFRIGEVFTFDFRYFVVQTFCRSKLASKNRQRNLDRQKKLVKNQTGKFFCRSKML